MRSFARILLCSACLLSLAAAPVALADDEDDEIPSGRQSAKDRREARRGAKDAESDEASVAQGTFGKEVAALNHAAEELAKVNDEEKAKDVAKALCHKFAYMNPLLGGSEGELLELSRAQNRVSVQMWRLMAEPYFESSRLQEAWTLMVDQFARRSAQNRRRK